MMGVLDLRRMHRELASIGRNLNQLSRAANQGAAVSGEDVRRVINAGIVQMEAVKGLYLTGGPGNREAGGSTSIPGGGLDLTAG